MGGSKETEEKDVNDLEKRGYSDGSSKKKGFEEQEGKAADTLEGRAARAYEMSQVR